MADINIGSDTLLVTALNDNDRVTITRQVTSQQVATMTVDDFRKSLYDFDYSLLTEHPTGEWFINMDGVRKPVYAQTFIGTIGSAQILLGANMCQLLSFSGYIETIGGGGEENMPPHFGGTYDWKYYKMKDKISIEIAPASSHIFGRRYLFVAKYVKY